MESFNFSPIAHLKCESQKRYMAPRQGVLAGDLEAEIRFVRPITEDCYRDLEGFERIWLIYLFHQNSRWKPKVRPPRMAASKKSVFATRSPYRPNPLGMSCVKLKRVEKGRIIVSELDLLDGTPILDIKPYLPYADSFPGAQVGWLKEGRSYRVEFHPEVEPKLKWLEGQLGKPIRDVVTRQLEYEPTCRKAKRVKKLEVTKSHEPSFVFSLETWRFPFVIQSGVVTIVDILSGYSVEELNSPIDLYNEKSFHREFRQRFV